jgi:hypothetical protein
MKKNKSNKNEETKIPIQATWYEVNEKTKTFIRVVGTFKEIRTHELVVSQDNENYVIGSDYNIKDLVVTSPDVSEEEWSQRPMIHLRAFSYQVEDNFLNIKPRGRKKTIPKLFPLPQGRSVFNPEIDLEIRQKFMTMDEQKQLIYSNQEYRDEKIALGKKIQKLNTIADDYKRFAVESASLMENIPSIGAKKKLSAISEPSPAQEESKDLVRLNKGWQKQLKKQFRKNPI